MPYSADVVTIVQGSERLKIHAIDLALWQSRGWVVDSTEVEDAIGLEAGQNSEVERLRLEVAQLREMIYSSLKEQIEQLTETVKVQKQKLQEGVAND